MAVLDMKEVHIWQCELRGQIQQGVGASKSASETPLKDIICGWLRKEPLSQQV